MTERLLGFLRRRVGHHGLAVAHESVLFDALGTTGKELHSMLDALTSAGEVQIISPLPFLVVRVHSWRSQERFNAANAAKPGHSGGVSYRSYSFRQKAMDESKAIAGVDGGAGEGEEKLLQEILDTLGETDPTSFRGVLGHYPEITVRAVLDRIRRTPAERVRKSKTAYFRFLLAQTTK